MKHVSFYKYKYKRPLTTHLGVSRFRSAGLGDTGYVVIIITGQGSSGCDLLLNSFLALAEERTEESHKNLSQSSLS